MVKLRFLGKESKAGDSPTLYATDRNSYVVQGYKIDDTALLAALDPPDGQVCVEVYTRLFDHLAKDGLTGTVTRVIPPIVHTSGGETCVVQGAAVTDAEVREQMRIPSHEDCVEIPKDAMKALMRKGERGTDSE